ncbi:mannopine transport system ATP-binding protein [Rhizobium azibense]|uniref:Spermidine/putrescine import ATP-binding protein PotA n=1 Tax=Rhizobium azibense TaxID=1136135 RepID=A0A4R3RDY1_9HYPH|nr:ABC transporter ATP-binding protein [Rhizobium azibense]TCU29456.1 mannopine transport system ATP-binding protein [Rhizobium azibense]
MIGAPILIDDARKHYGAHPAVRNVRLAIEAGEFVSILGPSGSGKTTLLTMIAGFELPSSGRIVIGGRDVTRLAPNRRDIGMVFQRYALFPHMTVAENVAFPLKMRQVPASERKRKVAATLELVQLGAFAGRYPHQLSGGQQQRVALARAIVFEPPVLLMDEPLGALDKKLREAMQLEIKQLQQRLGATVIYVTHDQEEALTMSDRVAVMAAGEVVQTGTPASLYGKPQTPFVADFIGRMSFADGTYVGQRDGSHSVRLSEAVVLQAGSVNGTISPGARLQLAMRPESLCLAARGKGGVNVIPGTLEASVFTGAYVLHLVRADTEGRPLIQVQTPAASKPARLNAGARVDIIADRDNLHVFERQES